MTNSKEPKVAKSSAGSSFKRRPISAEQVALAQAAALSVPTGGDPRSAGALTMTSAAALPVTPTLAPSQGSTDDRAAPLFVFGKAVVGGVYEVPIPLITSNPAPPRSTYSSEDIDEMGRTLKANKQIQAANGFINKNGGVTLIEGETRFRGAKSIGWDTLRIEIKPEPESVRALYEQARAANVDRNEQTPIDDAFAWAALLEQGVYKSQAEIGRQFGKEPDEMSRIMGLAKLPKSIINVIYSYKNKHPELLSIKVLDAIRLYWGVKGDDATRDLIFRVVEEGLGYRDINRLRTSAEAQPVSRPRSICAPVVFGDKAKGELKLFAEEGRLELKVKNLTPEQANALTEQVKALFNQKFDAGTPS